MALGGRKSRFRELSKVPPFAARDHRNTIGPDGKNKLLDGLNRRQRRALDRDTKRLVAEYNRILGEIKNSGAGFPVDKILHELCYEYTHRYASSGLYSQPLSFNYFEAFCDIKLHENSVAPFAKPADEFDHLFTIVDFFEYVTSADSEGFSLNKLIELPDDKALHFTASGNINDITFMTPAGREFITSGFSMIRRGNYLSWYIIGGELFSETSWREEAENDDAMEPGHVPPWKRRFLAEAAEMVGNKRGPPIPLEGTETAQRTVIAGEIDLISHKHLGRCYMSERANVFEIVCDDPELFDYLSDGPERESLTDLLQEKAQKTEVMWRLGEAFFQLPSYFAFKVQISKSVAISSGLRVANHNKKGGQGIGAKFKTVSTIDVVSDDTIPIRKFTPNHYQTETGGYWRRIAPTTLGTGPYGESAKGRTWVKRENVRPIPPDAPRTIYVKSTIASAKVTAEEYIQRAEVAASRAQGDDRQARNVLYVLRCTIMQDEVYKVGWTSDTAENRAKQISSATGVPNAFIVVGQWMHADPEALEKNVHAMLDGYRVADNREFFRVEFLLLKKIIEQEISRIR
ncbi:Putative phage-derived protein [Neorhizobium galegae bv. orientalis]|nr:Putative phage-derived protein [Neorhizobium galegae bv. orientalis]